MAGATARAFGEPLETLFGAGTCAGLSDGELLARFLAEREEAGEVAFEVLVRRHGPMVRGVCRHVLDDANDVHDAWQAVFLVLARRAGAIRNRESVASWLHGVAVRVTARARVFAVRRAIRERRTTEAAQARATAAHEVGLAEPSFLERRERDGFVHQEVSRLPEKYRAPIVLCYMDGLTHEEAAARLKWPVGTVRSRLSRGRDTLRRRLSRRGVAAPVAATLGAWLAGEQVGLAATVDGISGDWAATVVRLASQAGAGSFNGTAWSHVSSLILASGVLKMLMLKKLSFIAAVILSLATLTIGGGLALVRASQVQDARAKANRSDDPKAYLLEGPYKAGEPINVDRQIQELLKLVHSRYEMRSRLYETGHVGIDPLMDACEEVERVELSAAKTSPERKAAKQRHLTRLKNIEARAETQQKAQLIGMYELQGIKIRRMQVELELETGETEVADLPAILRRMRELEKKVEELERRVPRGLGGRI
jgi:RNA polymerase sigma factor (sigma-70 family)